MAIEISVDGMTTEARFHIMECAQSSMFYGKDPLLLFIELSELAADEGFADIYEYLDYYMNLKD